MDATMIVHLMGVVGVATLFIALALWQHIQEMFARHDSWADNAMSALEEAKLDIKELKEQIQILKEQLKNGKSNDEELGH